MTVTRGASNGNDRGSAEQRRRRKEYLLEVYAADVRLWRVVWPAWMEQADDLVQQEVAEAMLAAQPDSMVGPVATCRCYRCGALLAFDTMTVDRIRPGAFGGRYDRANIRPACASCNESTGGRLARWFEAEHQKALHRRRVRDRRRRAQRRLEASRAGADGPAGGRVVSSTEPPPGRPQETPRGGE